MFYKYKMLQWQFKFHWIIVNPFNLWSPVNKRKSFYDSKTHTGRSFEENLKQGHQFFLALAFGNSFEPLLSCVSQLIQMKYAFVSMWPDATFFSSHGLSFSFIK